MYLYIKELVFLFCLEHHVPESLFLKSTVDIGNSNANVYRVKAF